MLRHALGFFTTLLALAAMAATGQPGGNALTQRHWFEARTAYFQIFSLSLIHI